jgi:hypothetical protein
MAINVWRVKLFSRSETYYHYQLIIYVEFGENGGSRKSLSEKNRLWDLLRKSVNFMGYLKIFH